MRTAVLSLLVGVAWMISTSSSRAQELVLSVDSSTSGGFQLRPGETSESLQLNITRTGTAETTDFVTGWQASLSLVPEDGALGSLGFDSATEPQAGYAFESVGSLGVRAINSGAKLLAFDSHFPFSGGASVDSGSDVGLLEITLHASVDALGSFGLFAIPGLGNSEWSDASEPVFLRREFANVRDGAAAIRLANIVVAHPGDFDFDNDVDGRDFLLWQRGESFDSFSADDLRDWRTHFGFSANAIAAHASLVTIPEPSSIVLFLMAVSCGIADRLLR